ncbi:hypothetical protein HMPREF3203_02258 [Proteus mirabilis]|nr:hypothetical protein HMPREF3203_02258 [Proteus mirabilis]
MPVTLPPKCPSTDCFHEYLKTAIISDSEQEHGKTILDGKN